MTTVTSAGPQPEAGESGPITGWAIPVSSRRRASARALALSGTGVPDSQPETWRAPAAVSRSILTGEPPARMVPSASGRVPGSGRRSIPAGTSSSSGRGSSTRPGYYPRRYQYPLSAMGLTSS